MRKLLVFLFAFVCISGTSLSQMQDNPVTENGRIFKNSSGLVVIDWESLILTNGVWKAYGLADEDNEIVNWQTLTNTVIAAIAADFVPNMLQWSSDNIGNRVNNFFGTVYQWLDTTPSDVWTDTPADAGTETLTGPSTNSYTLGFFNRHAVIEVTTATATGAVSFVGTRVDETTGGSIADTNIIHVTGTNFYQTPAKWIGNLDIGTDDANIQYKLISTTYLDTQNRDFKVSNIRFAVTPGGSIYDIKLNIWQVNDNGSYTDLDTVPLLEFTTGDGAAGNGVVGHKKAALSSDIISGTSDEGIVVFVSGTTVGTAPSQIGSVDAIIGILLQQGE